MFPVPAVVTETLHLVELIAVHVIVACSTPPFVLPFKVIVSDVAVVTKPSVLSLVSESTIIAEPFIISFAFATFTTKSPVFVIESTIVNVAPMLFRLSISEPGPELAPSAVAFNAGNV